MIRLSNTVYNYLKYFVSIVLPATITLYITLGQAWNWTNTEPVVVTLGAIGTFVGVLIGLSSRTYAKEVDALFQDQPGEL